MLQSDAAAWWLPHELSHVRFGEILKIFFGPEWERFQVVLGDLWLALGKITCIEKFEIKTEKKKKITEVKELPFISEKLCYPKFLFINGIIVII